MRVRIRLIRFLALLALAMGLMVSLAGCGGSAMALAQSATPTAVAPAPADSGSVVKGSGDQKIIAISQLLLDILQGKPASGTSFFIEQARQSATSALGQTEPSDLFFLDFGNPNLRLNQLGSTMARNLLALTPLYVVGYLVILIYDVWRERPVPNPILFGILVIFVMLFLAAFGVITQGLSELGRAIATAVGGSGDALFARATLLDTILRVLANLQQESGIIASLVVLIAMAEALIILIQLAYRGLSMAAWRLLGVLLIPVSVLLEGVNPKTAGRVISGFFESWLDMVGKITLLLVVLAIASSESFAGVVWLILPAGLMVVVLSWKFLGVLFVMLCDAVAHAWNGMMPAGLAETAIPLPAAAEAVRAREIDEERRRLLEE